MYRAHDSIAIDLHPRAVPIRFSPLGRSSNQISVSGLKMPYKSFQRWCRVLFVFLGSSRTIECDKTPQWLHDHRYLEASFKRVKENYSRRYLNKMIPYFSHCLAFLTIICWERIWMWLVKSKIGKIKVFDDQFMHVFFFNMDFYSKRVVAFPEQTQVVTHRSSDGWSKKIASSFENTKIRNHTFYFLLY